MKVLLVSASDSGGAGTACLRLLRALRLTGVEARMLVLRRVCDDEQVFGWADPYTGVWRKVQKLRLAANRFRGDRRARNLTNGRGSQWDSFTLPYPGILTTSHPLLGWADVVHLHWCAQFWDLRTFGHLHGKRTCWTFHDFNPVTGGCHFPGSCEQFVDRCMICPQLEGARRPRVVEKFHAAKRQAFQKARDLMIISPSDWMSEQIRRSSLLRSSAACRVIPNSFDERIFHPYDRSICRDILSLPRDKKIILFAANYLQNYRKGMDLLMEAIPLLSREKDLCFCAARLMLTVCRLIGSTTSATFRTRG